MENPTSLTPTPPVETPTIPTESATPIDTYEAGGNVKWGEPKAFEMVHYLTFGLIISACAFSIYYHRQALMNLNKNTHESLEKDVREVKKNLQNLMGQNYAAIN